MGGPGDVRADIRRWRDATRAAADSARRTVLVAASCTANPIEPALGVALLSGDAQPVRIAHADYNQLFQLCLDPIAHGADEADDVVVIWRIEDVFERDFHAWSNGESGAHDRLVDGATSLGRAVSQLAAGSDAAIVVSDPPTPIGFGLDHDDPAELTQLMTLRSDLDRAFDEGLEGARVDRLRLAALQHAFGTHRSFDRRNWAMYRQPFSDEFAYVVGRAIADVMLARRRVLPKVLALDCDGTLWGGVAADDGIGGLECSDAFPGFSYRSFQIVAQRLRHRGVLLALVSKNDPETVERVFAEVDGMVLTDDDIAGRRVSWNPKPDSLAELADELNLGLDSFVFVDDSPFEVGAVREQLPDVRVLRVPADIEELPDLLAESGWFRGARITADDRERTSRMQQARQREQAGTTMSHAEFLASLDLRVRRIEVGPSELTRVTQLVNKTNQFNLTTRRRSEAEVAALLDDADRVVLAYAVDDRFGEYGVVAVVVAAWIDAQWHLDTVLMSCRVLGRHVETAVLADVVAHVRSRHAGDVIGNYVATDRNGMVATLFPDHGFDAMSGGAFCLPAGRSIDVPGHITVITP